MTLGPRFLPPITLDFSRLWRFITLDFSTFLKIFALDFDKMRNFAPENQPQGKS